MSGESDNIIVRMWVSCLVQHTDGLSVHSSIVNAVQSVLPFDFRILLSTPKILKDGLQLVTLNPFRLNASLMSHKLPRSSLSS